MSGWPYLYERMLLAKNWARRNGKAELVRQLNGLVKGGLFALNEVIMDHGNSLDTLITETFGQYGIAHEFDFELMPTRATVWTVEPDSQPLPGFATPFGTSARS